MVMMKRNFFFFFFFFLSPSPSINRRKRGKALPLCDFFTDVSVSVTRNVSATSTRTTKARGHGKDVERGSGFNWHHLSVVAAAAAQWDVRRAGERNNLPILFSREQRPPADAASSPADPPPGLGACVHGRSVRRAHYGCFDPMEQVGEKEAEENY